MQSAKVTTVKPLNKGHIGDNINSAVFSFIERLSSFRGSQCIKTIRNIIFGTSNSVERFIIQCPYFGGCTVSLLTLIGLEIMGEGLCYNKQGRKC